MLLTCNGHVLHLILFGTVFLFSYMLYEFHSVDVPQRRLCNEPNGSQLCYNKGLLVHYHTTVLSELSLLSAALNKLLFRWLLKLSFHRLLSVTDPEDW